MLSFGDPRRYSLRNGDTGIAATKEEAREFERKDREAFEANPQQRVDDLLEAIRSARKLSCGQLNENQYEIKQRLDCVYRFLSDAEWRLS